VKKKQKNKGSLAYQKYVITISNHLRRIVLSNGIPCPLEFQKKNQNPIKYMKTKFERETGISCEKMT
jgi:hypothetical protein